MSILCACYALSCDGENATGDTCTDDCVCGDGVCSGDEKMTCLEDCVSCGDGIGHGDFESCPEDCCGDGYCDWGAESCPEDCGKCGDGVCSQLADEQFCPLDCGNCGDGICQPGEECAEDCSVCGDNLCAGDERMTCPQDCVICGDGYCDADENMTCPEDCGGNNCLTPSQTEDCSMCSTNQNCGSCCQKLYPGANQAYFDIFTKNCACTAGTPCWSLCEGSYICVAGGPVNLDCKNCLGTIDAADACIQAAKAECQANPSCDGLNTCNAACDGLP